MTKQEKRADSVHPKDKGFTVLASPMNGVKFELGVILVVSLLFWMVVERLTDNAFLYLLLYGLVAMGWIVFRVRRVVAQEAKRHLDESERIAG
ncbi:MAG: hypothetical protein KAJ19_07685 [Gammaproteobacteria bacterium]|nr:hypothetical protein [Gammaproteobacteria bacterium]